MHHIRFYALLAPRVTPEKRGRLRRMFTLPEEIPSPSPPAEPEDVEGSEDAALQLESAPVKSCRLSDGDMLGSGPVPCPRVSEVFSLPAMPLTASSPTCRGV